MTDNQTEDLTIHDMKRKPIFSEINVETGHPEITVDNLAGQLEDLGFDVERGPNAITNDDIADGVKNYREYLEADRTEKKFREKAREYKKYSLISGGVTILLLLLSMSQQTFVIFSILGVIATLVLFLLSRPKEIRDNIYIRVEGKVYPGTKAREIRDGGKSSSGTVKTASSTYIHSEVRFSIAGDSEISVERLRKDVGVISKYLQKI